MRRFASHDLRHTFGTLCATVGLLIRTLQEWMGHRDTLIFVDYAPSAEENPTVERLHSGARSRR